MKWLVLGIGALLACAEARAEERITLAVRDGVETRFLYEPVANAAAQVVLFEGGPGTLGAAGRYPGFLEGSRTLFPKHQIAYAMFEPPSDRANDLRGGYRFSDAHTRDVDAIVAWLRQKSAAPVWLVGVSFGTQSVTWLGSRLKEPVAGLVFASSLTGGRNNITMLGLEHIRLPSFIIHHKRDGCADCPPSGVDVVNRLLPAETRREIALLDGGKTEPKRPPCTPGTFHTFYGMEAQAVASIATFIKSGGR